MNTKRMAPTRTTTNLQTCSVDTAKRYCGTNVQLSIKLHMVMVFSMAHGNHYQIDAQECNKLITLLSDPSYHIKELSVISKSAIISTPRLMEAINRNFTLTSICIKKAIRWFDETKRDNPTNDQELALMLSRNKFLSQPENNKHLARCQALAWATSTAVLETITDHQFPEAFNETYKSILPITLQPITKSNHLTTLFSCYITPIQKAGLEHIVNCYAQENYRRHQSDFISETKQHMIEIAVKSKSTIAVEFALKLYALYHYNCPNAALDFSENNNLLHVLCEDIETDLDGNAQLIFQTLLLALRIQPLQLISRFDKDSGELAPKIFSLLIKYTEKENLKITISATNSLIDKISTLTLSKEEKQKLLTSLTGKLTSAIFLTSIRLQNNKNNPWQEILEKLYSSALSLEMDEQQSCDWVIELLLAPCLEQTLTFKLELLFKFLDNTPHHSLLFFLQSTKHKKNFTQIFYEQLAVSSKAEAALMINLFKDRAFIAAEYNPNLLISFLIDDVSLFTLTSKCTHPCVLDLTLDLYKKAQQLDDSFCISSIFRLNNSLMNILNNPDFSLDKKRQATQIMLRNASSVDIQYILFKGFLRPSDHPNHPNFRPEYEFLRLIELHKDCMDELLIFLQQLPCYSSICNLLWSNTNLIADACSSTNFHELIPCAIAIYNACIVDTSQRPVLPLFTRERNSGIWLYKILVGMGNTITSTIILVLSFLLAQQDFMVVKRLLLEPRTSPTTPHTKSDTILHKLMRDDDGCVAGLLYSYIIEYQHEEKFDDQLWKPYVETSLHVLKTQILLCKINDNGNYAAPIALQLLKSKEWVEVFFNLLPASKKQNSFQSGMLNPIVAEMIISPIFRQLLLPYSLLAVCMFLKYYTNAFTYSAISKDFLSIVDVLLGKNNIPQKKWSFLSPTFNNLCFHLPKEALPSDARKNAFALIYQYCLEEIDNSSQTKFQNQIIHPLLEKLRTVFNTKVTALKTNCTFNEEQTTQDDNSCQAVYKSSGNIHGQFEPVKKRSPENNNLEINTFAL